MFVIECECDIGNDNADPVSYESFYNLPWTLLDKSIEKKFLLVQYHGPIRNAQCGAPEHYRANTTHWTRSSGYLMTLFHVQKK